MRQGQQHRRGRGRNNNQNNNHHRKSQNPLTRSFESNGPDVKVRGTPAHIAEKYQQLARDAQSSGDHVLAENYLQHAEHYNRIILSFREQQVQQNGDGANNQGRQFNQPRQDLNGETQDAGEDMAAQPVADDPGASEQPRVARHPGEQPQMDDGRPVRNADNGEAREGGRFRDRQSRTDGYDRAERGFERRRDRENADVGAEQDAAPAEDGGPRERTRSSRGEGGARRRERFGMGSDQPDFLRRPVRRPRRASAQADSGEGADVVHSDDSPTVE
ncbi:MAG: DUF4167 domain-containing protein [Hyphomicrobiaceae bacterium]